MFSKVLTAVVVACAVVMNVSLAENRDVKENCPNIDVSKYEKQCVKTEEILTLNDKELQIGKEYSFKNDAEEHVISNELLNNNALFLNLEFFYKSQKENLCDKTNYNYFEFYSFYVKNSELYLEFSTKNGPLPICNSELFFSNQYNSLKINLKINEEKIINFGYLSTFKITKTQNNEIKISLLSLNKDYLNTKKVEILNIEGVTEFL